LYYYYIRVQWINVYTYILYAFIPSEYKNTGTIAADYCDLRESIIERWLRERRRKSFENLAPSLSPSSNRYNHCEQTGKWSLPDPRSSHLMILYSRGFTFPFVTTTASMPFSEQRMRSLCTKKNKRVVTHFFPFYTKIFTIAKN